MLLLEAFPDLVAEPATSYDPALPTAAPTSGGGVDLDYPVLAQAPLLGQLLATLRQVDRLIADAIDTIVELQDTELAETVTGVPLEQWLLIVARRTGTDRRMLLTTADVCRRLPALRHAFTAGRISWSQVRTLVLQLHRLPHRLDRQLDAAVEQAIDRAETADPDNLATLTGWLVSDLTTTDETDQPDDGSGPVEYLTLQPRLDGTGGRFHGEAGPETFARLEAATDPGPVGGPTRTRFGASPDPDRTAGSIAERGRRRLHTLLDRLETTTCTTCTTTDQDGGSSGGRVGRRRLPPVRLLLRAELDTLCDRRQTPAQLLTRLVGGRMTLTATAARRLIDERGAELRTIVLDTTGNVVGVGRRTRIPPGWLTDAVLAVHDTCTEPGCNIAATACDLDHATPWHPTRADHPPGTTDAGNVGPLCRTANRTKEPDGWTATQTPDGTRHWHHPHTGLTIDTLPATTRLRVPPPDDLTLADPAPHHRSTAAPDGHDPPTSPPLTGSTRLVHPGEHPDRPARDVPKPGTGSDPPLPF
ncbi:HNH endonuclease signature motif containing protein [Egicoccus halophilus]|uniref:DUF222 domain-containing protein n=1 Tax=Egicoccus halophilus TaxID=1670830 RepID=A0A8J3EW80_9ACTN|nr:HNH endonuclease signature motif containing protein [Egicoccus halophilus]GGI09759.1 hypothetical protein GCM10011354_35670 [Egicoccus halophilus]